MIEEHIGEIRIRVRTDLSDAARVRPAAERVVRTALERCASLLEERVPGRIVLIRRLPLRWRFAESMFDDPAQLEELASATADAIERITTRRGSGASLALLENDADDEAVVFEDESHLRASFLASLSRAGPAWFHAALQREEGQRPLAALAVPEKQAIAFAALQRLARENLLVEVLAAQPRADVALLAEALGVDDAGTPVVTPVPVSQPLVASLAAVIREWTGLSPAAVSLASRIHAAVLLDTAPDTASAASLDGAARLAAGTVRTDSPVPPRPRTRPAAAVALPPEEDAAPFAEDVETVTTGCAGLFYLLDRVQELDLGQALWGACLPEGAVLAAAMSALLGRPFASDPAPALFGGVTGDAACPDVTAAQHADVAIATCAATVQSLPRRGLVEFPPIVVGVTGRGAARCLAAAAQGSAFAFFAWPAATPGAMRAGLDALLAAWPHRGLIHAEPALVTLDISGRLRPWRQPPPSLFLPEAPSPEAAALLAMAAGAPAMLLALRAEHPVPFDAEGFVRRRLALPGRVRLAADRMEVVLDADAVDMDLRRVALDRDPGWVPWLRRTVRFTFEDRR